MSEETENEVRPGLEDEIETVIEYGHFFTGNEDAIRTAFEKTVGSDKNFNNLDKLYEHLGTALFNEFGDDAKDAINEFINLIPNVAPYEIRVIEERSGEDLANLIRDIKLEYGLDMNKRASRMHEGRRSLNNITSDAAFRAGNPIFYHEMMIDYEDEVQFNADLSSTITLAIHFVQQVAEAPNQLGEDVLDYVSTEDLDRLEENVEELLEMASEEDEKEESLKDECEKESTEEESKAEAESMDSE